MHVVILTVINFLLDLSSKDESPVAEENTYSNDQEPESSENHSSSVIDSISNISPVEEYDQSKAEVPLATEASQHSISHTAPVYSNFGLVPQKIGSPFPTLEGAEMHARDTARLPGFVVSLETLAFIFLFLKLFLPLILVFSSIDYIAYRRYFKSCTATCRRH